MAWTPVTDPGVLSQLNAGAGSNLYPGVEHVESRGRDFDLQGKPLTSSTGAKYRMQVLPSTAANPGFGIKPAAADTPEEYNRVGREYLDALVLKYNHNPRLALAAYNWGHANVDKAMAGGGNIPSEVQKYVSDVLQKTGGQQSASGHWTPVTDAGLLAELNGEPAAPASEPGAISRSFWGTMNQQNPSSIADFLEATAYQTDGGKRQDLLDASAKVRSEIKDTTNFRKVPSYKDIHGLSDLLTYAGEQAGNVAATMAPTMAAGGAGTIIGGRVAGKPGATVGGLAGIVGSAYPLNVADLYSSLKQEGIAPEVASQWSLWGGVPITALDVATPAGWIARLTGEARRTAMRGIAKRLVQEAVKSGVLEASTEGAQQGIQQGIQLHLTGKQWGPQDTTQVIDAAIAGGIGGLMGGVGEGLAPDRVHTPTVQPGGPAVPAAPPPAGINPGTGISTVAPPAVGAPPNVPTPVSPVSPAPLGPQVPPGAPPVAPVPPVGPVPGLAIPPAAAGGLAPAPVAPPVGPVPGVPPVQPVPQGGPTAPLPNAQPPGPPPRPPAIPPVAPPAPTIDLTGAGEAIGKNMRAAMFKAYQRGETREAGGPSLYLATAKLVTERRGSPLSEAEFSQLINDLVPIQHDPNLTNKTAAFNAVVARWTGTAPAAPTAPTISTPPPVAPTPTPAPAVPAPPPTARPAPEPVDTFAPEGQPTGPAIPKEAGVGAGEIEGVTDLDEQLAALEKQGEGQTVPTPTPEPTPEKPPTPPLVTPKPTQAAPQPAVKTAKPSPKPAPMTEAGAPAVSVPVRERAKLLARDKNGAEIINRNLGEARKNKDRKAAAFWQKVQEYHAWLKSRPKRKAGIPKRPLDIIERIAWEGGIQDESGEVSKVLGRKGGVLIPGAGNIIRAGGMNLDKARELLTEAGYLQPSNDPADQGRTTVRQLLDAIAQTDLYRKGKTGKPVMSTQDQQAVEQTEEQQATDANRDAASRAVLDKIAELGHTNLTHEEIERATDLVATEGLDPERAIDHAMFEKVERDQGRENTGGVPSEGRTGAAPSPDSEAPFPTGPPAPEPPSVQPEPERGAQAAPEEVSHAAPEPPAAEGPAESHGGAGERPGPPGHPDERPGSGEAGDEEPDVWGDRRDGPIVPPDSEPGPGDLEGYDPDAFDRLEEPGRTEPAAPLTTFDLIARGLQAGIPKEVVKGQLEDINLIVKAHAADSGLFIVANDTGTGKTFVLGGAIRELKKRGVKAVHYVTVNQALIKQIKEDLKDYGLEGVNFTTYNALATKALPAIGPDTVLIFDEAHNIKNIREKTGINAAKMMREAKFTILASATPYENPVQAAYLEPTGVFKKAKTDFMAWALQHGAYAKGKARLLVWSGSKPGAMAARQWFVDRRIFVSRPKVLPPGMVESTFLEKPVEAEWGKIYGTIDRGFDDAMGFAITKVQEFQIKGYRMNLLKRVLEAAKMDVGVERAKAAMDRGKQVIIFVETKAERKLHRFPMRDQSQSDDTRYEYPEIKQRMDAWRQEKAAAQRMGQEYPPPPFAEFVEHIARAFHQNNIAFELPSVKDYLASQIGRDKVALYTGDEHEALANSNLEDWRAGRKQVIVATMAKGGTGLSLHDKVGDMPRAMIGINLPWTASRMDQVVGRPARYGMKSKAEIEWIFAPNIPFERILAPRVGARMVDLGATVKGVDIADAQKLIDFDFTLDEAVQQAEEPDEVLKGGGRFYHLENDFSKFRALNPGLSPIQAVEAWLVEKQAASGHEHMVVLRADGTLLSAGTGRLPKAVVLDARTSAATDDLNERLSVHHNHPSGNAMSNADVAVLAYRGVASIWVHTAAGNSMEATLTPSMRNVISVQTGRGAAIRLQKVLDVAYRYFETAPSQLGKLTDNKTLDLTRADTLAWRAAIEAVHRAGVINLTTNAPLVGYGGPHDLETDILAAVRIIQGGLLTEFGAAPTVQGKTNVSDRPALGLREPTRMGGVLDADEPSAEERAGGEGGARVGAPGLPAPSAAAGESELLTGGAETPIERAARIRREQKQEAELRGLGKQRPKKPQADIEEAPLFGGPRQKGLFEQRSGMTPAARQFYDNVGRQIEAIARQIVPAASLRLTGERSVGQEFEIGGQPAGTFGTWNNIQKLITIALGTGDAISTVRHEAIHALRQMGFIRPQEWAALERGAATWRQQYNIEERYEGDTEDRKNEEAVAEAFAHWRGGTPMAPGFRGIFQRIAQFFERVKAFLNGQGFQTWEDVMARIESGEVGARTPSLTYRPEPGIYERRQPPPSDPMIEAIRERFGKPAVPLKQRMADFLSGDIRDRIIEGTVDDLRGLQRLERTAAEAEGAAASDLLYGDARSLYKLARNSRGAADIIYQVMFNGVPVWQDGTVAIDESVKAPIPIIDSLGAKVDDYEIYAWARRAAEALQPTAQYPQGRLAFTDIPRPELQRMIDAGLKLGVTNPEFVTAFADFRKHWDGVLSFAQAGGMMTPELRHLFDTMHKDYVPWHRIFEDPKFNSKFASSKLGFQGQHPNFWKLKGDARNIERPLIAQERNIHRLVEATIKNVVMLRAEQANAVTGGTFMEVLAGKAIPGLVSNREMIRDLESQGLTITPQDQVDLNALRVLWTIGNVARGRGIVTWLRGGKVRAARVHDPMLYRAFTMLNRLPNPTWIRALMLPKRVLTAAVGLDPTFQLRNILRDTIHSAVVSHIGFIPVLDSLRGLVNQSSRNPHYRAYMAAGAGMSNVFEAGKNIETVMKRHLRKGDLGGTLIDSPQRLLEVLEHLESKMEVASRMGTFMRLRDQGVPLLQAAYQARDNQVDFAMRGSWAFVRFLADTVPFFNAGIQGIFRTGRGASENLLAFALKGSLLTAAALLNWSLWKDDDRYKELTDDQKDSYMHLWVDDVHFKYPMPFEVGAFFADLPIRAAEYMTGQRNGKDFADRMSWIVQNMFRLDPRPQAVRPIMDVYYNWDPFRDAPVVPPHLETGVLPPEKYNERTSQVAIKAGRVLNMAPLKLEQLVQGYFGAIGTYGLVASDYIMRAMGGGPSPEAPVLSDYPVVRGFMGPKTPYTTLYMKQFYDMKIRSDQVYGSFKQLVAAGQVDRARELIQENKGAFALRPALDSMSSTISEIDRMMRMIAENPRMSGDQKRERLDSMRASRNKLFAALAKLRDKFQQ